LKILKKSSEKLYLVHFLLRNKKQTKEMRLLKRRSGLAAHKCRILSVIQLLNY